MTDEYVSDTGPFVIVPEWVLSLTISHGAFRLYALIARYADYSTGEAFPSRATLAERLSVSDDTIDRWLRELTKAGAVEVTRRKNGNVNKTNLYRIIRVMPEGSRTDTATLDRNGTATRGRKDAAQTKTNKQDSDIDILYDVRQVFEKWIESLGKDPTKYRLDNKRRRLIAGALEQYSLSDVLDAVVGWKQSAFHRGNNDRGKTYNDLSLILRDAEHIERFRDMQRDASTAAPKREIRNYDLVRPEPCGKCDDGWIRHTDDKGRSYAKACPCQKETE